MLYLIGGTSRAGKSILARNILKKYNIPFFSLDWAMMGFTIGIPDYGIHDKLFMDEIGEKMWSFTKAMCKTIIESCTDYVIEGEAMLPVHMRELDDLYPGMVNACCVGYGDIDLEKKVSDVKTYNDKESDWLVSLGEELIRDHIKNMKIYSIKVKKWCEENGVKYFDTSYNFSEIIDEAAGYLIGNK